ncbi:TetR/AcrR family transcriptional regulator [Nostocoides veronense]|uniref:TetR family transcriptional regulator n=1 Tax=Nostocoides veronense TaxID=330836 RepID=A0ABN2LMB8_9MICO
MPTVERKSERTRELVVETALRLFRERGYDATTMRLIATEAGVSQGNAYYYFDGKEALVQELYVRIQAEHRERLVGRLRPGAPLAENLALVLHAGLDTMAPFHSFGSTLVQSALRTSSGVSPFAPDSAPAREAAISLMREVTTTSRGKVGGRLGEQLPRLLWLAYLGVTLHWVVDDSPGQERTRVLVERVAPLLGKAIRLAGTPVAKGFVKDLTGLVDAVGGRA